MLNYLLFALSLLAAHLVQGGAPGTNGELDNPKIKELVDNDAKIYLSAFGYMSKPKGSKSTDGKTTEPSKYDLQAALLRFQKAFLIYHSGVMDVPTHAKMNEYRCGIKDLNNGEELQDLPKKDLWQKKVLLWNITSYPSSLTPAQTREACDEAFEKWRQVAGIDFIETENAKKADIVISFEDFPRIFMNVAAGATRPPNSRIIMDRSRIWGYRNHIPVR
ncbi:Matrixin [Necator americanus]|uniref:Matrixin n=1 Tax=Necator americanus TaxID=51031 RepID=W2T8X3_NECAM|nr:Matrixin [Necator americanus]ETN78293.1 Matrixin [Necator americanus]